MNKVPAEISVKCVVSKEISVGYDVFNELW